MGRLERLLAYHDVPMSSRQSLWVAQAHGQSPDQRCCLRLVRLANEGFVCGRRLYRVARRGSVVLDISIESTSVLQGGIKCTLDLTSVIVTSRAPSLKAIC